MRVIFALLGLVAAGCAAGLARETPMRETLADDPFLATFEAVQLMDGGVMVSSATDESGHTTIYRTASVPMDQMIHIWGPDHPAVPIFFSPHLAMRFAILAGYAVQQKLPEKEAEAWAWRKLHELAKPEPAQ